MRKRRDIAIGQRFNKLTILEEVAARSKGRVFRCRCDCGNIKDILMMHIVRSKTMSCGCYRRQVSTKHGMWESREYATWENMIQRCTNPKSENYYLYGGRGITVCDQWSKSFEAFYEDMGSRPDNTSLDRIDGNKGYYKENCKWSTPREQMINAREFNRCIIYNDVKKSIEEWLIELNLDRDIFKSRLLRGLGFKAALLNDVDIIVLDIANKQMLIYHISEFISITGFNKDKVLQLMDNDHEEPYHGYLFRYLVGFENWPAKYV